MNTAPLLCYSSSSGKPATLVSIDNTPAKVATEATITQFTSPITPADYCRTRRYFFYSLLFYILALFLLTFTDMLPYVP